MDNKELNELSYEELTNMLIDNPEMANDILSKIDDTSKLEELYNVVTSKFSKYDNPYESNQIAVRQVLSKISNQLEKLELRELKAEFSSLDAKDKELSEELSNEQAKEGKDIGE